MTANKKSFNGGNDHPYRYDIKNLSVIVLTFKTKYIILYKEYTLYVYREKKVHKSVWYEVKKH